MSWLIKQFIQKIKTFFEGVYRRSEKQSVKGFLFIIKLAGTFTGIVVAIITINQFKEQYLKNQKLEVDQREQLIKSNLDILNKLEGQYSVDPTGSEIAPIVPKRIMSQEPQPQKLMAHLLNNLDDKELFKLLPVLPKPKPRTSDLIAKMPDKIAYSAGGGIKRTETISYFDMCNLNGVESIDALDNDIKLSEVLLDEPLILRVWATNESKERGEVFQGLVTDDHQMYIAPEVKYEADDDWVPIYYCIDIDKPALGWVEKKYIIIQ